MLRLFQGEKGNRVWDTLLCIGARSYTGASCTQEIDDAEVSFTVSHKVSYAVCRFDGVRADVPKVGM